MSCPICARPALDAYRPFCSKRCADVDLGRWMTGGYAIPVPDDDAGMDDPDSPEETPSHPH